MIWTVDRVVRVVDGDTVYLDCYRIVPVSHDMEAILHPVPHLQVRVIILDTPERGQPGYREATSQAAGWLMERADRLMVETYAGAGWDRVLGDIFTSGDRADTLTQAMLLAGWDSYIKGA